MSDYKNMRRTVLTVSALPFIYFLISGLLRDAVSLALGFLSGAGIGFSDSELRLMSSAVQVSTYVICVPILKLMLRSNLRPVMFKPRSDSNPFLLVASASGLLIVASRFITNIMWIFTSASGTAPSPQSSVGNIVIMLITSVLVPAFFEELFFRGLILTNLLPVGKSFAIVMSALIFGIIHGNIGQIPFATLSGVVLGWLYVESGSVWCGIFAHLINNLLSVCESGIISAVPEDTASRLICIIEASVMLFGLISFVFLIRGLKRQKDAASENGSFGFRLATFRPHEGALDLKSATKLICNPIMLLFVGYIVYNMVTR